MDKSGFFSLIKNYTASTKDEAVALSTFQKKYPYSQIVYQLLSRAAKDQQLPHADTYLQYAALYSSDRAVLKKIITAPIGRRVEVNSEELNETSIHENFVSYYPIDEEVAKLSPAALRKDLKKNLTRLIQLKKQFEKEFPEALTMPIPDPEVETRPAELPKAQVEETQVPVKKAAPKKATVKRTKKAVIKKEVKNITPPNPATQTTEKKSDSPAVPKKLSTKKSAPAKKATQRKSLQKTAVKSTPKKSSSKKNENIESLIEAIKQSKKQIEPESPKQKEQLKIIDNFIKAQPIISNKKKAKPEEDPEEIDLAANSVQFGDSIISETLADILIQQGKKDKAIEVLKKLIWKFPQKKAYFAAQIEVLKK